MVAFQEQISHMYDQIVYKDKNLLDLNNKLLEQERRMIDIQELVGEKNEVIRGRDKVIEVIRSIFCTWSVGCMGRNLFPLVSVPMILNIRKITSIAGRNQWNR